MKQGWQTKTIGELFETGSGGTPLKMHKEYYEGGDIPWLRSGEVCKKYITETELFITKKGLENSSAKFFPPNSVVVAMYGATAGQVGILKMRTTTNQAVCGIFPSADYVPEFVYYSLLSKQKELVSQATGNAQPNISQIKIKNVSIPLLPLSEQQRIVSLLDAEFAKIDTLKANAERNLQNAKDLFQAALKKELEPKVGWETKPLIQVVDVGSHISYGIVQPEEDTPDGVPIVRPMDLTTEILTSTTNLKRTKQSISEAYQRSILKGTEILLCVRGTTGIVSLSSVELKGCNTTRGIVPLCITENTTRKFVYYVLCSEPCQKYISEFTNGTALKQINIADVKNIPIVVAPYAEQTTITSRLDVLSEKCKTIQANYEKTIALCDDLKRALLRKAFNGEI